MISDARELRHLSQRRALRVSPTSFTGTLDDLWTRFIEPNTPTPESVIEFHNQLVAYLQSNEPLLLVRYVRGMERRTEYATSDGTRLKATDNSPAWWIHYALHQGFRIAPTAFACVLETIPTHFHDVGVAMSDSANVASWHVAHIHSVKNGDTDFVRWRRQDAIGRCVRNIHPCNYFLVPKTDWQRWGGDERVIGFFAERYRERYSEVWSEFLRLASADDSTIARVVGDIPYHYPATPTEMAEQRVAKPTHTPKPPTAARIATPGGIAASYRSTRLLFKRDVIEPLALDQWFEVVTPHGTFRMTKSEFRSAYANVCETASYRDKGIYSYSTLPKSARRFLVDEEPTPRD